MAERQQADSLPTGTGPGTGGGSYPGEALGLPERGPGALAGFGIRLGALAIDWLLCALIAASMLHPKAGHLAAIQPLTYAIFAVETYLLTALTGFTVGKRILGLRVRRLDGRPVGFGWAAVRTLLLLAAVPALLTDRDLRGLHDRAANTVVVRA